MKAASIPRVILIIVSCAIVIPGCKSPEERAMDQLEEAMEKQTYMMKRMQETMDKTQREMEQVE
jgi:hypothetical protein